MFPKVETDENLQEREKLERPTAELKRQLLGYVKKRLKFSQREKQMKQHKPGIVTYNGFIFRQACDFDAKGTPRWLTIVTGMETVRQTRNRWRRTVLRQIERTRAGIVICLESDD